MSRALSLFSIGIFLAGIVGHAQAQTWTPQVSGNWSVGANWNPGVPTSGATTVLNFSGANATYTATNDLGNPFVVNGITFGQRFNTTTIASAASNSLELGGANPFITTPVVGGIDPNSTIGANITSAISLNPASGAVTFGGSGLGTLSLSGVISSASSITLNIAGNNNAPNWSYVRLVGANTFTGTVNLNGGHLVVGNATALGNAANTLVYNSGWIGASTATTIANNVTLNNDMQVMGLTGVLTLSGVISGNSGLRLSGLTSSTSGLTLTGTNTYSGQTVLDMPAIFTQSSFSGVANGLLTLSGANGAISNTSGVIIRGGTLALNDATPIGVAGGRINDSANITLNGGVLTVASSAGTAYNEQVAGLVLDGGSSIITVTPTTTSAAQISFTSLTRQDRATVLFRGTSLGIAPGANVGTVSFSAAPTGDLVGGGGAAGSTNISILPYGYGASTAAGTGDSLVTFDSGRIRPLSTTEYAATMTGGTSNSDNVRLVASLDLADAGLTTRNALVMTTGTLSNSSGGALRLTSGVVLNSGIATITAPLDFGAQEAIFHSPAGLTVNGQISGSGGLTKSGGSILTLGGVNNYSGTTSIQNGTINFAASTAFGSSTQINSGSVGASLSSITRPALSYTGTTAATLTQNINVKSGLLAVFTAQVAGTLQLDGQISGAGGLFIAGTSTSPGGRVILTNNSNSYTGQTIINSGTLVFSNDSQLGNGGAVNVGSFSDQGILLNGDWTTSRHFNSSFTSRVDTNGFNWNQNGAFTGSGGINKFGNGVWNLNSTIANSTMTGAIGVLAGRMNVNGFLATSTNAVTVSSGAVVGGTGEIDRPITMSTGSIMAPGLSPGTLTDSSRSAAAVTFNTGSIYEFEINNATGTLGVNWDRLVALNSAISLPNALTVRLLGLDNTNALGVVTNFNNANNYLWEFATAPNFSGTAFGSIAFTIDSTQFVSNNPLAGGTFSIVQIGGTGLGVQFTAAAIPEPGSLALLGGLLIATVAGWRNRRR